MISTWLLWCMSPLRLHQKKPIRTFFFVLNYVIFTSSFTLHLSFHPLSLMCSYCTTQFRAKTTLTSERTGTFFLSLFKKILLLPWNPIFLPSFIDCLWLSGSAWRLATSPPNFFLQTFRFQFLTPPSQFWSPALHSYGRWHLESGPLSCTQS